MLFPSTLYFLICSLQDFAKLYKYFCPRVVESVLLVKHHQKTSFDSLQFISSDKFGTNFDQIVICKSLRTRVAKLDQTPFSILNELINVFPCARKDLMHILFCTKLKFFSNSRTAVLLHLNESIAFIIP